MFELRETGDWDIFLGPPERAREETDADQWVLKRRECSGFAGVNKVTSASLRYPLSVFNLNSTFNSTLKFRIRMVVVWACGRKGMGLTGVDWACVRKGRALAGEWDHLPTRSGFNQGPSLVVLGLVGTRI